MLVYNHGRSGFYGITSVRIKFSYDNDIHDILSLLEIFCIGWDEIVDNCTNTLLFANRLILCRLYILLYI